ncbi:hypothetical protein QTI33_04270 [Variovorax sp. J22P271]|uniref:hypothetical protein n=1 Tax=Variovorax davisae TaxID=3053515 RepID=UPI00257833DB|nr:hypothetical protein [Variovorax sp. J22P271]MDM0031351.1 hypothetical protein [Variovorax sp. J22P271]
MNPLRILGLLLIFAGILSLALGHVSFTKSTHQIKIGPVELAVKEKRDIELPIWAGIGAIVVGGVLVVVGGRKR